MDFHTATLLGVLSPSDILAFALATPVLVGMWLALRAL